MPDIWSALDSCVRRNNEQGRSALGSGFFSSLPASPGGSIGCFVGALCRDGHCYSANKLRFVFRFSHSLGCVFPIGTWYGSPCPRMGARDSFSVLTLGVWPVSARERSVMMDRIPGAWREGAGKTCGPGVSTSSTSLRSGVIAVVAIGRLRTGAGGSACAGRRQSSIRGLGPGQHRCGRLSQLRAAFPEVQRFVGMRTCSAT